MSRWPFPSCVRLTRPRFSLKTGNGTWCTIDWCRVHRAHVRSPAHDWRASTTTTAHLGRVRVRCRPRCTHWRVQLASFPSCVRLMRPRFSRETGNGTWCTIDWCRVHRAHVRSPAHDWRASTTTTAHLGRVRVRCRPRCTHWRVQLASFPSCVRLMRPRFSRETGNGTLGAPSTGAECTGRMYDPQPMTGAHQQPRRHTWGG